MRVSSSLGAVAVLIAMAACSSPARAAITDAGGAEVANTAWTSTTAQVVGSPGCAAGTARDDCRLLAEPGTPGDDAPAALDALGATGAPEDDLEAALSRLAGAPDAAAARAARDEAL